MSRWPLRIRKLICKYRGHIEREHVVTLRTVYFTQYIVVHKCVRCCETTQPDTFLGHGAWEVIEA